MQPEGPGTPAVAPGRPTPHRGRVLAVSTAAMGLGAAPTYLVGYIGPELKADLGLTGAQLGLLVGLFYGATGVTSLLVARVVDRLGARRCVTGDLVLVVAGLVAAAATNSAVVLAVTSGIAGAGYAFANAGTSVAVTSVSRRDQAGTAVALKTAGIPASATVMALAGPPAASALGWQGVCLVLAGLTAVTAVAAARTLPSGRPLTAGPDCRSVDPAPARVLLGRARRHQFRGRQPAAVLVPGGQPGRRRGTTWCRRSRLRCRHRLGSRADGGRGAPRRPGRTGPTGAHRSRGERPDRAGHGPAGAGTHLGLALVVVGAILGLMAAMVGAGMSHAVAVDRAPHAVGRATAVMSCGYYLGALVAPLTFGRLADVTGGYDASWAVTVAAALVAATSLLVVQRFVRPPAQAASASSQDARAVNSLR